MDSIFSSSPASLILLIVTTGVSLVAFANPGLWRFLALEPYRMIHEREFHGIITSGFVHANFVHLLVNMMTLYFFGPPTEQLLGGTQFLAVYAFSLLCGNLWPMLKHRNDPSYVAIGASGAISGVLFSFCLYEPTATIYVFFSIPMNAILFAVLYLVYSVYAMRRMQDNIGHEAHLGGAVGGIVLTIIMNPSVISDFISRLT